MATLKEHQAAMLDLLATGSGIPASASRLAHAMHDLLGVVMLQSAARENAVGINYVINALRDATTPGLNDKALSKREKALKIDSHAKWPTPAEQRVKELTNTCTQLRKQSARYRATIAGQKEHIEHLQFELEKLRALPEQAGCRKEDTQTDDDVCPACSNGRRHVWTSEPGDTAMTCMFCGDTKPFKVTP